jgi:hypothetical protein
MVFVSVLLSLSIVETVGGMSRAANPQFQITIPREAWQKFGFRHPTTYVFACDAAGAAKEVQVKRRDADGDTWSALDIKTPEDFFNGVEGVRFDAQNGRAYVSVGFHTTPAIQLEFLGTSRAEFVEVARYYDGRQAAYTLSIDNWGCKSVAHPGAPWKGPADDASDNYQAALHVCRRFHLPVSIAINTGLEGGESLWQTMQTELDRRDLSWEPSVHAETHPCSAAAYAVHGYRREILGCRDEILQRLRKIPFGQHIFEHILTCGYVDDSILQTDADQFLFVRGYALRVLRRGRAELQSLRRGLPASRSRGPPLCRGRPDPQRRLRPDVRDRRDLLRHVASRPLSQQRHPR